ncbi:MAG TPA: PHP domain-containing protein, partial [Chloroflexota bacterium]
MSESTGSYVELHCHSNYSMLDGASHPEELVARAKELGMEALAITDHDGLYGAVRFWQSAVEEGIRPIVGAEFTMVDGSHLVLLAENRRGYANLCRLVTAAHMRPDNQWTTGPRSAQSRVLSPESSSQHSAPGT